MRSFALLVLLFVPCVANAETDAYIGTYTRGAGGGIHVAKLNETTGALSEPVLAASMVNPSFVAIHPTRPLLYAVSEVSAADEKSQGIVAFRILKDGTLKKLNGRSTQGASACHLAVDPTGKCVAVANYTGGSCISFPIESDGSLGEAGSFHQHVGGSGGHPQRQAGPHAHSINFNAAGTQAFVADLGKDQILLFDVDPSKGEMTPSKQPNLPLPVGGGPRHFSFHPDGKHAYTNLEMTSEVAKLDYDATQGTLRLDGVWSTLPSDAKRDGYSTAECLVHPSGRFLYVSNRGHNSIAAFAIDPQDGSLTPLGNTSTQGEVPRGFGIDPSGQFLLVGNRNTGKVVTLRIDLKTGKLSPTGQSVDVEMPVNVRFRSH
ncbi:MAG: lactonase family protein [Rubripirellula sp.]